MVTLSQLISKIETRQVVKNKSSLLSDYASEKMSGIASLANAQPSDLTFLSKDTFANKLAECLATAVIVNEKWSQSVTENSLAIIVDNPYLAYASCSQLFDNAQVATNHIHPTAILADTAKIGKNVTIGAYSIIADNVEIADNTQIANHVTIDENSIIGINCVIKSNVVIASQTNIGNDVRIHAGAVIGSEGFGFAPTANPAQSSIPNNSSAYSDNALNKNEIGGWERIAQLGRVIIGNHVRIGANTAIDRGAIDDTVIEDNVIIDNLVQIAHNVRIGTGSAIAANSGIAGSSTLGKRCIIGGAVGIAGHLTLCDDVHVTGMSMVTKSITKSGSYSSGNAAMPSQQWRRSFVKLRQMGKQ